MGIRDWAQSPFFIFQFFYIIIRKTIQFFDLFFLLFKKLILQLQKKEEIQKIGSQNSKELIFKDNSLLNFDKDDLNYNGINLLKKVLKKMKIFFMKKII